MTLDLAGLLARTRKPVIADISLRVLQELYEEYLFPYTFIFELDNGDTITLHFEKDNFCHLLGLEKMVEGKVLQADLKNYRGVDGWNNIKNGTIDIQHMRTRAGKANFNSTKGKMLYFLAIPHVIESSKAMVKINKLGAELLIYGEFDNAIVHLGISRRKETNLMTWCPRTILEEGKTPPLYGKKYIKDINPYNIISFKREKRFTTPVDCT